MSKKRLHKIALPANRVFRIGPFALAFDPGQALIHGGLMFVTSLSADHHNADGELISHYDFGSGLITVTLVNTLVSDAVTGSSVVPTLARFKYMDSGTSSIAATDGDTALNSPCQTTGGISRASATLSNNQTATTGNHAAILKYVGTITYPGSYAVTEWGRFDSAGSVTGSGANQYYFGGNLIDHKVFSAVNVSQNDMAQQQHKGGRRRWWRRASWRGAAEGARLVVTARRADRLEALAAQIRTHGERPAAGPRTESRCDGFRATGRW